MLLVSLFSEDRCMANRDIVMFAVLRMRGLMTLFQAIFPCCEKLSWNEPKPGSKVPSPETISPGRKAVFTSSASSEP